MSSTKLEKTLNEMDKCLADISTKIGEFQSLNSNFELAASSSKNTRPDNARINLAFAFGLNSLYYCKLNYQ